ncbi:phosphatase PAP2 family protein [Novosphingobium tardum]|uniref:Phosphatase PAP2 family protein n=1 Tax=Novosphingobium tardum TaxID=1538021 RepID=A0ABV8RUH0_9SPHN
MTKIEAGSTLARTLRGHRVDSKILVLFLLFSAAAFGLLWLASEVIEGETFAIDRLILRGLRAAANPAVPIGPRWLALSMIDVTALGSSTVLTLITILTDGYLIAVRKRSTAVFVALSVATGALFSGALKELFFRPRPEVVPHLVEVTSASFPSGHAMNSAVVYLTLATLLGRSQEDVRGRVYLLCAAIALTLMIGFSRVFLGVHWPSDVVAGWAVGAAWAAGCSLIGKSLQRHRRIEGAGPEEGS